MHWTYCAWDVLCIGLLCMAPFETFSTIDVWKIMDFLCSVTFYAGPFCNSAYRNLRASFYRCYVQNTAVQK